MAAPPTGCWFTGTPARDGARDVLSGVAAGFVCKSLMYPLDTIKVLLQVRPHLSPVLLVVWFLSRRMFMCN